MVLDTPIIFPCPDERISCHFSYPQDVIDLGGLLVRQGQQRSLRKMSRDEVR
jgi:hypothetical protein